MFICTLGLVPISLAPVFLGFLGSVYATVAVGMNVWFVVSSIKVLRRRTDEAAQRMFRVSLAYLFALYLAMLVDLLV